MADNHGHVQVQKESEPMGAAPRVLVVDDNKLVQIAVGHALRASGLEVLQALDGDEAILMARTQRPDIALLDIRMDGKSGFEVADYLRDVLGLPFMFLSAHADVDIQDRARASGAWRFLVKPLEPSEIARQVRAVLDEIACGETKAARSMPVTEPAEAEIDLQSAAIGVLMHRHGLARGTARLRLRQMAAEQGLSPGEQAQRLIEALEELVRSQPQ